MTTFTMVNRSGREDTPIQDRKPNIRIMVINLLESVPALRVEQIQAYISRLAEVSPKEVEREILKAKSAREIWVDSKGIAARGKKDYLTQDDIDCMDAFQIVLSFLPGSSNFVTCRYPLCMTFVDKGRIIDVIVATEGSELALKTALKNYTEEDQKADTSRIAIVRGGVRSLEKLSGCGITTYATVNSSNGAVSVLKTVSREDSWK